MQPVSERPLPRELSRLQLAGRLIGPGGVTIKGLYGRFPGVQIETGAAWEEHMFGVIEVAAPTAEALEACRLAIEQIVGFAVSPHAPSRVLLDLRADSPLLGKLRADRYAIASRVRASCGLMELEVPGRDNSFECVAAVGTLDNCLTARDMLAAELQLGALAAEVEGGAGGAGGGSVARYTPPPRFNLKAPLPIRKVLFFPEQADEPGPYHPESGPEEESLSTLQVFLKYLDSACESIDVCVFNITDDRIARRLLDAHRPAPRVITYVLRGLHRVAPLATPSRSYHPMDGCQAPRSARARDHRR